MAQAQDGRGLARAPGAVEREWRRDPVAVAGLALLFLLVVLAIDPRGNFPLNDDWAYARAVRSLIADGELRLIDWGSVALLTQLLWGAAFSLVWGFSFEVLRASTLVLGLVAVLSIYGLVRELGGGRTLAAGAAFALLAQPLFLLLAHTFMTDVPFLGWSLAALFLLVRGFERDSRASLAAGIVLALVATLTRQIGLALLVGVAAATLCRGWRRAGRWILAVAPLATGFALLRGYQAWLEAHGTLPIAWELQWGTIATRWQASHAGLIGFALGNVLGIAIETGLFALPLAAAWMAQPRAGDASHRRRIVLSAAAASIVTALLAWRGLLVPFFQNGVWGVGCETPRVAVGPLTLAGACTAARPGLGPLGIAWRTLLTGLGVVGFGAIIAAVVDVARSSRKPQRSLPPRPASIVLLLATAVSYIAVASSLDVFDRYLIFPVALALALLASAVRGAHLRSLSLLLVATLALGSLLWSVGAVQEYLDWNRARWRAIAYLAREQQARRDQIDGGFEFGGWMNFEARFRHDRRGTSSWWVADDRYAVAFEPREGYLELARFPYRGWFGREGGDVLALERETRP